MKKMLYMFIGLCLITQSCEHKLDLSNPNRQTTADFWKTREQAYAACTAIYNALTVDGTYMRSFPGLSDSRGDDFYGESPWLDLVLTGEFIIPSTSDPVYWIWRDFYLVVNRANQVLAYVSKYDASVLGNEEKNRILGQAYFLRGLAFYNLALSFHDIPIITEPFKNPDEFFSATSSQEEIWKQITSDLQNAEANLPISYDNVDGLDKGQKGRATRGAAAGLLGKAYLYEKDYANAGAQFVKFFTGGPLAGVYSLMADYRDNFKDVNENNAESLFEIQFTEGTGSDINWCCDPTGSWKQVQAISVTYGMEGAGFSDYLPTRWIYNEYKKEKTVDGKDDPRLLVTIASKEPADNSVLAYGKPWWNADTAIYPRKYTNDGVGNGKTQENAAESGINYRVLRYSDILLMYAECLNEANQTAAAYPFIQKVRTRVGLPDLATVKPNMTQAQMRDQLAHERLLEFCLEGHRFDDIRRWGWLSNPTKLALLKANDPEINTYLPGREYYPIPQTEIDNNPGYSQNSSY